MANSPPINPYTFPSSGNCINFCSVQIYVFLAGAAADSNTATMAILLSSDYFVTSIKNC